MLNSPRPRPLPFHSHQKLHCPSPIRLSRLCSTFHSCSEIEAQRCGVDDTALDASIQGGSAVATAHTLSAACGDMLGLIHKQQHLVTSFSETSMRLDAIQGCGGGEGAAVILVGIFVLVSNFQITTMSLDAVCDLKVAIELSVKLTDVLVWRAIVDARTI